MFHVDLPKPYKSSGTTQPSPPPMFYEEGNVLFHVEHLVAECVCTQNKHKGKPIMVVIYLAKWAGYGPDHGTWEPEVNITDPYSIAEFDKRELAAAPAHALRARPSLWRTSMLFSNSSCAQAFVPHS